MNKPNGGIAVTDEIIFAPPENGAGASVYDSDINSEITEEFTLPDYLPEIRRLLRITPSFSCPSGYTGSTDAEFAGNADWSILYVGGDGKPSAADLSSSYEVAAPVPSDLALDRDAGLHAEHSVFAESIAGRVTAPRKLSIKSLLRHHIRITGERNTQPELKGCISDESIKKLGKAYLTLVTERGVSDPVEVETVFRTEAGVKVIGVRACAAVDSCLPSDMGAVCNGTVVFTLLCAAPEGETVTYESRAAFEAPVELDLDGEGRCLSGYAYVNGVTSDEAEGSPVCRASLCVECYARKNAPVKLICDIYSTEQTTSPEFDTFKIPYLIFCTNTEFSHDGSTVFDGLPEGAKILDCVCDARQTGMRFENGKYFLDVKCRYNVLFGTGDEYTCREAEQSFSAEVGTGNEEQRGYSARLTVMTCRAKTEGENIALSADIAAEVAVFGEAEIKAVTSAEFGEKNASRRAAWTVAYAAPGETLWDIAKRYSTDPAELAAANGLKYSSPDSDDSLAGTNFLIV